MRNAKCSNCPAYVELITPSGGMARVAPQHGGRLIMIPMHEPPGPELAGLMIAALRLSRTAWDRGWYSIRSRNLIPVGCQQFYTRCLLHPQTEDSPSPLVKLRSGWVGGKPVMGGQCPQCGAVLLTEVPE